MQFGINDELKAPKLFLKSPDENIIQNISAFIRDLEFDILYNGANTFTFKFYKNYYNSDLDKSQENEYYNQIEHPKYIRIENYDNLIDGEYNIIGNEIANDNDGKGEYREVQFGSSEVMLQTRKLTEEIDGTYYLYNTTNPENTILGIIIKKLPNWELGHVDTTLMIKKRTFNIKEIDIYSFLYNDVSEAFECIFLFDSINGLINVYDINNDIKMSNLRITTKNLIKSLNIKEETDQLITSLYVKGGDGVYINDVNLAGGSQIYNFDYYREKKLMSQALLDALDSYDIKVASNQERYSNLIVEIKNKSNEILELQSHTPSYTVTVTNQLPFNFTTISPTLTSESGLSQLNTLLTELTTAVNNRIALGFEDISDINVEIAKVEKMIADKENAIKLAKDIIDANRDEMTNIRISLNFENNFSTTLLKELDRFVKEDTLQSNDFIYTDIMTTEEKLQVSQDLLEFAKDSLARMSSPRYTFNINSINVLASKELQELAEQLILGDSFLIELSKDKTFLATLMQIKLKFGLDNVTNFEVGFGNRNKLDTSMTLFNSFRTAVNMGTNYSYDLLKMENSAKKADESYNFATSAINLTGEKFLQIGDQSVIIDETGISIKDVNSTREIRLNSGTIMFSEDNFKTFAKSALGRIVLPDGTYGYGLIASHIIGEMIIGNSLEIKNENLTFLVNADGVSIKNGNLTMTNGNNKIILNANVGLETYKGSKKVFGYNINTGGIVLEEGFINAPTINGGQITGVTFNNGNGTFKVDANGNAIVNSLIITNSGKNSVDGGTLVPNTVDGKSIKADTITANNIKAGTITATEIAADYVYAGVIAAEQIVAGKLTGFTIDGGTINVETDLKVGKNIYMRADYGALTIFMSDNPTLRYVTSSNNLYFNANSMYLGNDKIMTANDLNDYATRSYVDNLDAYDIEYKDNITIGSKLSSINSAILDLQSRVSALESSPSTPSS